MDSRSRKFAAALTALGADEGEERSHGIDDDFLELINQQLQTVDVSRASDGVQLHDDTDEKTKGDCHNRSGRTAVVASGLLVTINFQASSKAMDEQMLMNVLTTGSFSIRVEFMDKESKLLEAEAERSNSRLKQMKSANKKMSATRMQLHSAIKETETKSSRCLEHFDEMEIKAVTILSGCLSSSYQLMDVFPKPDVEKDDPFEDYHQILEGLSSLREPVINRFKHQVEDIQSLEQEIPTPEHIAADLSVLQELSTEAWMASVASAEEAAFDEEIGGIVNALSQDDQIDLSEFLSEDTITASESAMGVVAVDVNAELAAASKLDQVNILRNKKNALDDAIRLFKEHILPPLQAMHDCLSAMHAKTVEAEALLGALGEEIEAVADSVHAAEPPKETTVGDEHDDLLLFSRLSDFFKLHEHSRPKGAPPLVLLDAEDIKNEVKLWMEYEATLLKAEHQILANIPPSLENLTAKHAPLLSAVYKYSPLNSSRPFSDSPQLTEVKKNTQAKVDALGETLAQIQKDVELIESRQAQKKFSLFVSKWTTKK
ncbi:hypothetical protein EYR38_007208 [Pleurotus pulmonarius]|nr:hypothetical protein EYR38_007208 [Pleurotus pulmonarius]